MRPVEGIGLVAATLARLLGSKLPGWVTPTSQKLARDLVASLRADIEAHEKAQWSTETEIAQALGVSRTTLYNWRADGWLKPPADAP